MSNFDSIQTPTLLLNAGTARQNIQRMAEKARRQGVRFRPHFKTHQSAGVGEWFRAEGVQAITVSSLQMAEYFARHGWDDITIAFPANLREMDGLCRLASQVQLGLLIESEEAARRLDASLPAPVDAWIKVDVGGHRTGLAWDQPEPAVSLARTISAGRRLRLRGLLTHAGHTYAAQGAAEAARVYLESVGRINFLRDALVKAGFTGCQVSTGDTPGATCSPELGRVDEIRPGNFVFFDAHQLLRGVCTADQVAVAAACPVVALHPERREVVLYGGAIHLSKDFVEDGGRRVYGLVALPGEGGWSQPLEGAYLRSLSQEHGVAVIPGREFDQLRVGDLLCVLPAHSCLAVSALGKYRTLAGEWINTFNLAD